MSKQLCIKILVLCSRIFLRTCGIGLIFFYFTLAACVSYSFYFDIMPYYSANNKTITQIIAFTLFSMAFFGSVYNYLFAAFSSPGYTSEHQITLRNDIDDPESVLTCETCKLPKPLNAHHCSFCNKCVINLDHHCPWINNCIGYNNLRYFLLFLFYTLCAILIYSACVTPMLIYGEQPFEQYPVVFILSVVLSYAVGLLLVCFCAWSWYLALTDQQFIDVLKSRDSDYEQAGVKNIIWEVKYLRLRFLNIFGTTNFLRAFLPQWGRLKLDSMHYDPESAELMMYE